MKIYEIELRDYRKFIVVATDSSSACEKLKKYLDDNSLGFASDRDEKVIKIVADEIDTDNYSNIYRPRNYR